MQSFGMPYSLLIAFLFIMLYYKYLGLKSIYYFCEIDYIFKTEQWKDIPEYEGIYQVSDLGRIKALGRFYVDINNISYYRKEILLKTNMHRGYLKISLQNKKGRKCYYAHQIIAISFLNHIICRHKLVVNHKNFIRNDNRVINLEIITHRENSNKKHLKSTSKYVGVFWVKQKQRWVSKIEINGVAKILGFFKDEKEASQYYNNAVISHNNNNEIQIKKHIYTSTYKGVSWDKFNNKWRAKIYIDKKAINLGRFKTEIEANNSIVKYLSTH